MLISRSSKPNVLISMGDPSGIGPEVILKALASPGISGLANFLVIGSTFVLEKTAKDLRLKMCGRFMDLGNVPENKFSYGKADPVFGVASLDYIDKAIRLIADKRGDCLVTAPINKASVLSGGKRGFEGHTEYMRDMTGAGKVAMMFVGERLKIALVTRHIPLMKVSRAITYENICSTISLTHSSLIRDFGIRDPRIAVSGLNPHAGEGGMFGKEEEELIAPAIKRASKNIKRLFGPVSPDVVFNDCLSGRYDACVAMYHDQGLIPFKLLYFKTGVNMTIGLPFVRTSPDHGTAFDIAGRGLADPSSMVEAIKLAVRLTKNRCLRKHS